ncbi:Phospho-2-dehydro-3-deoxyheptonate aldolase [Symbiodinium microadriaticum]|uniref:Phospho-2-dehydro-3-deoxyheptonate aldolase n=1 Tax=Symbiodinium microadriaticum TaxID=2951 RepID=A0A1Q9F1Y1_SYMMI|nr:Phospho-2-dehydro-3-deoxyheptonate aldolase [Symbiodinium microadriaticum]
MQDVHFRQSWAVMDLAPRVRRTTPFDAFILDPLAYEPSEIGRRVPQGLWHTPKSLQSELKPRALGRGWHTPDISRHPSREFSLDEMNVTKMMSGDSEQSPVHGFRPPALNRGWHTPDISRHPSQDSCVDGVFDVSSLPVSAEMRHAVSALCPKVTFPHLLIDSFWAAKSSKLFWQLMFERLPIVMAIHKRCGSVLGGVHLEVTGQAAVTEVVGGSVGLTEEMLTKNYETYCDPRLNYSQAIEAAFRVANEMPSAEHAQPIRCCQKKQIELASDDLQVVSPDSTPWWAPCMECGGCSIVPTGWFMNFLTLSLVARECTPFLTLAAQALSINRKLGDAQKNVVENAHSRIGVLRAAHTVSRAQGRPTTMEAPGRSLCVHAAAFEGVQGQRRLEAVRGRHRHAASLGRSCWSFSHKLRQGRAHELHQMTSRLCLHVRAHEFIQPSK